MNPNQQQTGQNPGYMPQYAAGCMPALPGHAAFYPAAYTNFSAHGGYQVAPGSYQTGQNPMETQYMGYYGMQAAAIGQTSQGAMNQQDFVKQYEEWKKQYDKWLEQTKDHPNQAQFQQWHQQMQQWEQQMSQVLPQQSKTNVKKPSLPQKNSAPPVMSNQNPSSLMSQAGSSSQTSLSGKTGFSEKPPQSMTGLGQPPQISQNTGSHPSPNVGQQQTQHPGQQIQQNMGNQSQYLNQNYNQPQQHATPSQSVSQVPNQNPWSQLPGNQGQGNMNNQQQPVQQQNSQYQSSTPSRVQNRYPQPGDVSQQNQYGHSFVQAQAPNQGRQFQQRGPGFSPRGPGSQGPEFRAPSSHGQASASWPRGPPPRGSGPRSTLETGPRGAGPGPEGHRPRFPDDTSKFRGPRPQGPSNHSFQGQGQSQRPSQSTRPGMPGSGSVQRPSQNAGPRAQNNQGRQSLMSMRPRAPQGQQGLFEQSFEDRAQATSNASNQGSFSNNGGPRMIGSRMPSDQQGPRPRHPSPQSAGSPFKQQGPRGLQAQQSAGSRAPGPHMVHNQEGSRMRPPNLDQQQGPRMRAPSPQTLYNQKGSSIRQFNSDQQGARAPRPRAQHNQEGSRMRPPNPSQQGLRMRPTVGQQDPRIRAPRSQTQGGVRMRQPSPNQQALGEARPGLQFNQQGSRMLPPTSQAGFPRAQGQQTRYPRPQGTQFDQRSAGVQSVRSQGPGTYSDPRGPTARTPSGPQGPRARGPSPQTVQQGSRMRLDGPRMSQPQGAGGTPNQQSPRHIIPHGTQASAPGPTNTVPRPQTQPHEQSSMIRTPNAQGSSIGAPSPHGPRIGEPGPSSLRLPRPQGPPTPIKHEPQQMKSPRPQVPSASQSSAVPKPQVVQSSAEPRLRGPGHELNNLQPLMSGPPRLPQPAGASTTEMSKLPIPGPTRAFLEQTRDNANYVSPVATGPSSQNDSQSGDEQRLDSVPASKNEHLPSATPSRIPGLGDLQSDANKSAGIPCLGESSIQTKEPNEDQNRSETEESAKNQESLEQSNKISTIDKTADNNSTLTIKDKAHLEIEILKNQQEQLMKLEKLGKLQRQQRAKADSVKDDGILKDRVDVAVHGGQVASDRLRVDGRINDKLPVRGRSAIDEGPDGERLARGGPSIGRRLKKLNASTHYEEDYYDSHHHSREFDAPRPYDDRYPPDDPEYRRFPYEVDPYYDERFGYSHADDYREDYHDRSLLPAERDDLGRPPYDDRLDPRSGDLMFRDEQYHPPGRYQEEERYSDRAFFPDEGRYPDEEGRGRFLDQERFADEIQYSDEGRLPERYSDEERRPIREPYDDPQYERDQLYSDPDADYLRRERDVELWERDLDRRIEGDPYLVERDYPERRYRDEALYDDPYYRRDPMYDRRRPFDDRLDDFDRRRDIGRERYDDLYDGPRDYRHRSDLDPADVVLSGRDMQNRSQAIDYNHGAREDEHRGKRAYMDDRRDTDRDIPVKAKPKAEVVAIGELLDSPGRDSRPERIVFIFRGVPGSGKTHIARLIKDKELACGAPTPRILSLDDYFLQETSKYEQDPETGKKVQVKETEYVYEAELEESYRKSMFKSFNKTLDDGFFPMVILDCVHNKVDHFDHFWSIAKQKGFEVYVAEITADANDCAKRNIHKRSLEDINKLLKTWEETPAHYIRLDVRSLLQDAAITEVEMEAVEGPSDVINEGKAGNSEDAEETGGEHENLLFKSRWNDTDLTEKTLDKLDGIRPRGTKRKSREASLVDDDLDEDPYDEREEDMRLGKKRVRWADIEERKHLEHRRKIGFCIGTDWSIFTNPDAEIPQ